MTSQSDYSSFYNNGGSNSWFSMTGITSSFKHNLIDENQGGLAGVGISLLFNMISANKAGGKLTTMNCEEFDGDMCEQNSVYPNYSNRYVIYKDYKLSSLSGLLNDIDLLSKTVSLPVLKYTAVKKITNTASRMEKIAKVTLDKYEKISNIIDIMLNMEDIMISSGGIVDVKQSTFNDIKNLKQNIDSFVSELDPILSLLSISKKDLEKQQNDLLNSKSILTKDGRKNIAKSIAKYLGIKNQIKAIINATFPTLPNYLTPKEKTIIFTTATVSVLLVDKDKYFKFYDEKKSNLITKKNIFTHIYIAMASHYILKEAAYTNNANERRREWYDSLKNFTSNLNDNPKVAFRKIDKNVFSTIYKSKKNLSKILEDSFKKIKDKVGIIKMLKSSTNALNNLNYSNIRGVTDYLINYIVVPLYYQGIDNLSGIIKERLQKAFIQILGGGIGVIANVANEAGGKVMAFTAVPNKMTLNVSTADMLNRSLSRAVTQQQNQSLYFSSGIKGVTPIMFNKGIYLSGVVDDISQKSSFLKVPTNDSYNGVIITNKNHPSYYRPFFDTYFQEPKYEIQEAVKSIQQFAKINWQYDSCPTTAIVSKGDINESICKQFKNNNLDYDISGKDVADYILQDRNLNKPYFDFFDYLAVNFSAGKYKTWFDPGIKNAKFNVKNKTRGIFLDKISAKYYSLNNKTDSKFDSPEASDVIFKMANANDIDISVTPNDNNLTIMNNTGFPVSIIIIKTSDYGKNIPPMNYSFTIPANSSEDVDYSDISLLGKDISVIAVDHLFKYYAKYIGMDNPMDAIYDLKPKGMTYKYYFDLYSSTEALYPFMNIQNLNITPNTPPTIENEDITMDKETATLTISASDAEGDPLTCNVNWGDETPLESFDCSSPVTHTYTKDGVYKVTITVSDDKGATAKTIDFASIDNQSTLIGNYPLNVTIPLNINENACNVNFGDGNNIDIQSCKGDIKHTYKYPGVYMVRIKQDNKEVYSTPVIVNTNGKWAAYVTSLDNYHSDIYDNKDVIKDGRIYISPNLIDKNYYWTNYDYIDPSLNDLNGDDLTIETKVKDPDSEGGISCYDTTIRISGTNGKQAGVSFMSPGCTYYASVGAADWWQSGGAWSCENSGTCEDIDLSSLGQDFSDWKNVKIKIVDHNISLFYEGQNIYNMKYKGEIGKVAGIQINFKGSGSLSYISLKNNSDDNKYIVDFNKINK
jgi:hypothetical protein